MGRDPAPRFKFIQNSAAAVDEGAIDAWALVSALGGNGHFGLPVISWSWTAKDRGCSL